MIEDPSFEINPDSTSPEVINLPIYSLIPCGSSMTYTRALQLAVTPLDPLPAFISFSDTDGTINVSINNPADTGVYSFRVVAIEPVSGLLNEDVTFVLTLTCTINRFFNTAKGVSNKVYEVYPGENPVLKLSKPLY